MRPILAWQIFGFVLGIIIYLASDRWHRRRRAKWGAKHCKDCRHAQFDQWDDRFFCILPHVVPTLPSGEHAIPKWCAQARAVFGGCGLRAKYFTQREQPVSTTTS